MAAGTTMPTMTATGMPTGTMTAGFGFVQNPGSSSAAFTTGGWLIDDLEDADDEMFALDGSWFSLSDGVGEQTFVMDTACDRDPPHSVVCARSMASGFPDDVGFGFSFLKDDAPIDASAYRGIRFYGKNDPGGRVDVAIVTASSDAAEGSPGFLTSIEMSATWQQFNVVFDELSLASSYRGPLVDFRPDELVRVQIQTVGGVAHDISVDDVEFF
jgi:hypothetical protein